MPDLMSIGKSAMFASYAALQTTGNNIANVNTPGYSRQQVQVVEAPGQFTGSGFFGKGVNVASVTRAYDQYLTANAVRTASTASADAARLDKLTQLEGAFPIGSSGVGYAAGEFLNAFRDLANNPADSSARQVVLSDAQELASRFGTAADQINTLQAGVTQDLKVSVARINTLAQQVAKLNQGIASQRGVGQAPNQLLDERDQLVSQIGSLVNVTTLNADDGSVGLFIGGGQNLVLGANANTMTATPDPFDASNVQLGLREGSVTRQIAPDTLAGGSISGLLKFQNEDLVAGRNLLGQLATAISGSVDKQQSLGLDLGQPAGKGAAIFSVGAARVLGAAGNAGTASLSLTVSDSTQVQASDYALNFDGANYALTRLADGQAVTGSPFTPAQLATGIQRDGLTLKLNAGTAVAGDRFLLQPVALAAQNMTAVLANPNGIAAASPFTGSTGSGNTGTATVASLVAVNPAYNGSLSASISFTSGTGNYNWSLSDGTSGSGTWTAGSPISLNGFELKLDGVPRSADTLAVVPTVSVASSNGNALAMVGMAQTGIVATLGTAGNVGSPSSVTDAYASAIANIGVRVQSGQTAAKISGGVATGAEAARANKAGVNLDEEAARLIQFQQSYQAAAKMLQVAQAVFTSMLQAAGG
ncbi:MAG: flagellar hook-associated protein FlgK [Bacteriovorax sp.]|nr:flagellar hook-associated protein FlgK [Rhizobacter sp.]